MSIFNMKDGFNTNFDLYAMQVEDYKQRKEAEEEQQQLYQENLCKIKKNIFF